MLFAEGVWVELLAMVAAMVLGSAMSLALIQGLNFVGGAGLGASEASDWDSDDVYAAPTGRMATEEVLLETSISAATSGGWFHHCRAAVQRAPGVFWLGGLLFWMFDYENNGDFSDVMDEANAQGLGEGEAMALGVILGVVAAVLVVLLMIYVARSALAGGWITAQHDALTGHTPTMSALISRTDLLLPMFAWMLVRVVLRLSLAMPMVLALMVVVAAEEMGGDAVGGALGLALVIGAMGTLPLWLYAAPAMALTEYFIVFEARGPLQAFAAAMAMVEGHRGGVYGLAITTGLTNWAALLGCCLTFVVGGIYLIPMAKAVTDTAWCRAWLRARHGLDYC